MEDKLGFAFPGLRMKQTYQLYIDGEFTRVQQARPVINPADGEPIAEAALAGKAEVELAMAGARHAIDSGEWSRVSLSQRKEFLLRISQGILDEAAELARLETLNTGKPIKEASLMDLPSSAKVFAYYAQNLERFLLPQEVEVSSEIAQVKATLLRQPYGVAVLIVPWNYPLLIASWKLAQALAAGNSVILKPSSLTPLTALALAKIIHRVGLPRGAVNVINSSGSAIGELLCADKRVDLISFTGSNKAGSQVIGYAAQNVKKLIMELGGNSAAIILKDADLEAAVNGSLCSAFLNQGQMCTQMSRILVEEEIYDKFRDDFVVKAKRIKLGVGLNYETQMGPLISEEQRRKVIGFVEQASREGARLLCGGKAPQAPELSKGFFFEPTVFSEVTPQMGIFQEEVFGPVCCLSRFSGAAQAVALANKSDFALANCIWTEDASRAELVAEGINSGTTWVNTYGMFLNEVAYGGFKQSGFGKELGREGLLEYGRLKGIITDQSKDAKPLVNYWYGF